MYDEVDEECRRAEDKLSQLLQDDLDHTLRFRPGDNVRTTELCAAILSYTTAANMCIVTRVLDLPRELRNTIYTALIEPENGFGPAYRLIEQWRVSHSFHRPWLAVLAERLPDHFFHPRFVGTQFATEVLELVRDTIGMNVSESPIRRRDNVTINFADMRAFVDKTHFGIGMSMEELVQTLGLRIRIDCEYILPYLGRFDANCGMTYTEACDAASVILRIPFRKREVPQKGGSEKSASSLAFPRLILLEIRHQRRRQDIDPEALTTILRLVVSVWHRLLAKGFESDLVYLDRICMLPLFLEGKSRDWTLEDWDTEWDKHARHFRGAQDHILEKYEFIWRYLKEAVYGESW